ncbi:PIR protein, putative [Plasmodium sp.]|nr:PIR protein, putative [Plasmodium sp.]
MKLHYSKILLFSLPLNILAHNKNKLYITPQHTPTTISRVLSEYDIRSSIYDNDAEMKSVKENFDRQTSQRFDEYEERMKGKRQKRKEERDKNIQEIIEKDRMDKSLAEKVEKGCLRCGCGLGGVGASVGLFGGLGIYGWKNAATTAAMAEGAAKGLAAAEAVGAEEGVKKLISGLQGAFDINELNGVSLDVFITTKNYCDEAVISEAVKLKYESCLATDSTCGNNLKFAFYKTMEGGEGTINVVDRAKELIRVAKSTAENMTVKVTQSEIATAQETEIAATNATSTQMYSAIGYSVLAILIIVLVMIIIYLVLRYRRKKKMNKKAQYTKLLKE